MCYGYVSKMCYGYVSKMCYGYVSKSLFGGSTVYAEYENIIADFNKIILVVKWDSYWDKIIWWKFKAFLVLYNIEPERIPSHSLVL